MKTYWFVFLILFSLICCEKNKNNSNEIFIDPLVASEILITIDTTSCGEDFIKYPPLGTYDFIAPIPDSILKRTSTCGLVKTCFNYPGYGFYSAHNNVREIFDSFSNNYEVLKELNERTDFANKTIANYYKIHLTDSTNTLQFDYINLIMASDILLSTLDNNQIKQLIVVTFDKISEQNHLSRIFGVPYYTYYILAKLMIYNNYEPFILVKGANKDIWGGPLFQDITLNMENIANYAKEYFNTLN